MITAAEAKKANQKILELIDADIVSAINHGVASGGTSACVHGFSFEAMNKIKAFDRFIDLGYSFKTDDRDVIYISCE